MEQITAKQQAIINAYGEYWEQVKEYVDENGWVNSKIWLGDIGNTVIHLKLKGINIECKNNYSSTQCYIFRPKQLVGLEDNRGWISILSEEQYDKLPNGFYEWYNINTGRQVKGDLWQYGTFTHYKIIETTPPPIY
jgi:hypothetical protein